MAGLDFLPDAEDVDAERSKRGFQKGASRLQLKTEAVKSEAKDEQRWRREVWLRDCGRCRWCHRKVQKTIAFVPDRGEVHHVSGRGVPAIRWDRRNGALLCAWPCHGRLTGKVNEKYVLMPTKTFTVAGKAYANADYPLTPQRIA